MSYEATDVGSSSIMCSYIPVKEMKVIDVPRKWNQMKNDPRSYVRNLCNCIRSRIAPVSPGHGFKPRWSPEFCCLFSLQILRGSFFIWFTHFSWLSIKRTLGSGRKGVRLRECEDNLTLNENVKALGKDWTQLPVLNLPLCHWLSQFTDLHTHDAVTLLASS